MSDFDKLLLQKGRYLRVIEKLQARVREKDQLKWAAPIYADFNLNFIFNNRKLVIKKILTSIKDKNFEFSKLKLIHLKQKTGKVRRIFISSWGDRILQMVMADIISEKSKKLISNQVFSFQKGIGPLDAVNSLSKYIKENNNNKPIYILRRDITAYGDSISQDRLLAQLTSDLDLKHEDIFYRLIVKFFQSSYFDTGNSNAESSLIKGIPSGSPFVPPFENMYLVKLDSELEKLGGFYMRYGDDFVYASTDKENVENAMLRIDSIVNALGLSMKEEKKLNLILSVKCEKFKNTDGFKPVRSVEVLGKSLNSYGIVGAKVKKITEEKAKIKKQIAQICYNSRLWVTDNDEGLKNVKLALESYINHFAQTSFHTFIFDNRNEKLVKELDHIITHAIVAGIKKNRKIKGKQAWKMFKKMKWTPLHKHFIDYWYKKKNIKLMPQNPFLKDIA
jgi:hypothetical protein